MKEIKYKGFLLVNITVSFYRIILVKHVSVNTFQYFTYYQIKYIFVIFLNHLDCTWFELCLVYTVLDSDYAVFFKIKYYYFNCLLNTLAHPTKHGKIDIISTRVLLVFS